MVGSNVKINFPYYQQNILAQLHKKEIPALGNTESIKAFIHQFKASSHTLHSTIKYMGKIESKTNIHAVPFNRILVKSPYGAPMDYCAFGSMKWAIGNRRPTTVKGLLERAFCTPLTNIRFVEALCVLKTNEQLISKVGMCV